jgi:hypothetical protein
MSRLRVTIIVAACLLVLWQFFQPVRNISAVKASASFGSLLHPPDTIAHLLQSACADCHSNNTSYPFYARVQPIGWWLNGHIRAGKAALNFDEFGNYSTRRRISKLKMMEEQLRTGKMPLRTYTWLHPASRLSAQSRETITRWLNTTVDSLVLQ